MPGTQETGTSAKPPLASKLTSEPDYQGLQMLAESYNLSMRYGSEYMDENPLVGEPGSFILTKSREPAPPPQPPRLYIKTSAPAKSDVAPELKNATPFALAKKSSKGGDRSPITPGTKEKKGRRKSKAVGVTTTPK